MAKMGRPQKIIDKKQFENLCKIQCTEEEICAILDVSDPTLNSWCKKTYGKTFLEVFKEKRTGGKASLRRSQWKLAETNATLAIWLGKQYLGQRDEQTHNVKAEVNALHGLSTEELRALAQIDESTTD